MKSRLVLSLGDYNHICINVSIIVSSCLGTKTVSCFIDLCFNKSGQTEKIISEACNYGFVWPRMLPSAYFRLSFPGIDENRFLVIKKPYPLSNTLGMTNASMTDEIPQLIRKTR